ncbi:quinol:cytochrome C oxidoreductase [Flavobacterium humi]|uniref:Quinol:cytochrome C oxidoreductase n=1 Tax=Flavobacterium humi TaxID=2562683 RepID=A0A4Z0L7U4_9FLAO|nr:quinol:cytochrome C oxidoreductase [Flavobacterium humi]TGD58370.1 quinol:cytochrome C oxidoreductase [Flavobacterium humi]
MYTFSSKLKNLSLILMVLGALGIGVGFFTAPKNTKDVEAILAADSHGGHHAEAAHEAAPAHAAEAAHEATPAAHQEATPASDSTEEHVAEVSKDSNAVAAANVDSTVAKTEEHVAEELAKPSHEAEAKGHEVAEADEHAEHLTHVLHQLQNKPWAAFYVAALFFMLISLGVLAFYAIQHAAQAGWSPVLFRVMEAITAYLVPGAIIVYVVLVLSGLHLNHLFVWMDPAVVAEDKLLQGKQGYLNVPFFLIRAAIFMGGWIAYRHFSRKNGLALDQTNDLSYYKKNFKLSAGFLAFFLVSESMMSWDWIMSVDPHWFSTLFGWYVFASFVVSAVTVIALVTLYLKSRGYLEYVNNSHFHDLAKFMFGFSVFWTYLWFSQFMLIWYANIPEEVVYFKFRIEHYNLPFFGMVVMNFVFPILILINTDFKRVPWIISMAGLVILAGHYLDFHNMIYPATVGDQWFIGLSEISSIAFFAGLFIFVVFTALTKAPLLPKGNPLVEESKHFHY